MVDEFLPSPQRFGNGKDRVRGRLDNRVMITVLGALLENALASFVEENDV